MKTLPTFNEETLEWDPPPADYLPDYGVVFNDSGHGEAHLGYIFYGYTDSREGGTRFIRPAFLRKNGEPKYVDVPSSKQVV
ncbi:hypothetical protein G6L68_25495 [Agrobacterium fabrum]|uniref:hypothetical protein n=1 Tax=Agrobacterium fabrum TaxID=1176649 RepID=UPI000EF55E4A|nr:hypothetical protein [Agrobacterium fabrum]AYM66142.1 hypothetical protein At12D13_49900 [Agrobacterium fabrum]NTE63990.1 hypothetical protein [Agrobacterium fabrum]